MRLFVLLYALLCSGQLLAENVHQHSSENSPLARALKIGTDTDGKALYLCLARLANSLQPGKTWAGYGRCNVPYGGKEYISTDFTIPENQLMTNALWQDDTKNALPIGKDTNGTPLFLCQTFFKGSKQPGKTWPGYQHCNISYGGIEIITNNFRVLGMNKVNTHQHPSQAVQRDCIQDSFGNKACGYNCIKSINKVGCARTAEQRCVSDNFGNIVCGFNCVKSPLKVACADQPWKNCVINSYNQIRCGKNCQIGRLNQIQCAG